MTAVPSLPGQLIRALGQWVPPSAARQFSRPAALLFHGVEAQIDDPRVQIVHHQRDTFLQIAKSLKENFDILPLTELGHVLKAPRRNARALFLMSDDGYLNNLTDAATVLGELNIPWTLFVSTKHIDTRESDPLFLARLFFYFAPSGSYRIDNLDQIIDLGSKDQRRDVAHVTTWRLKMLAADAAKAAIECMLRVLSQTKLRGLLERFSSEKFLTWSQVKELHKRGVEIGAHAHFHWPMRMGSTEYFLEQALLPKQRIEAEIGPCRFFAYPFGTKNDVGREAWQAARDAGYEYAFTTLAGSLDASTNRWLMPRYTIGLHEHNVAGMVPLLRTGNLRLSLWQRELAA